MENFSCCLCGDAEKLELSCITGGEYTVGQPLWEMVWQVLKKVNIVIR